MVGCFIRILDQNTSIGEVLFLMDRNQEAI
jgi:hypothetical protein